MEPFLMDSDDRAEYLAVLVEVMKVPERSAEVRLRAAEAMGYLYGREPREMRVSAFRERCSEMGEEWRKDMLERMKRPR